MSTIQITSILLFILSLLCISTSLYAFRRYSLNGSETLFAVCLSMGITAVGVFCGSLNDSHLTPFNFGWAWYAGTSCGFLFLFVSSMLRSIQQFRSFRRWGVIVGAMLIMLLFVTPLLPPFPGQTIPVILNSCRTLICFLAFGRYVLLYTSKGTRFSLIVSLALLFVWVGYAVLIPQLLQTGFDQLSVIGALLRIFGIAMVLVAYVLG